MTATARGHASARRRSNRCCRGRRGQADPEVPPRCVERWCRGGPARSTGLRTARRRCCSGIRPASGCSRGRTHTWNGRNDEEREDDRDGRVHREVEGLPSSTSSQLPSVRVSATVHPPSHPGLPERTIGWRTRGLEPLTHVGILRCNRVSPSVKTGRTGLTATP